MMADSGSDRHSVNGSAGKVLRIGPYRIRMPESRLLRIGLGCLLIFCGILGFLPVLGFWMIPLGLLVLSHDLPAVRRWRRRLAVKWGQRKRKR
ncbi:hypothetical protein [Hoeflea prorocentri]|uniref:Transmembrane protein (PGPGW) n=1 Tax=Hoeflea prorocentri TaxID=1922333 RepID=A0A9X3UH30_9HYPH|nr:hypothetical protein [Hoeflea prorocentri]MCY6380557.1 hypothetical protein [Hoeflea prorocentri]MDA5398357.1 hypothetical protein [Hoeflea prorocentri]